MTSQNKYEHLSKYMISLDFETCFVTWKVFTYLLSCGISVIVKNLIARRLKVGKYGLYFIHYWPKCHSALLSLVLVEYSFICTRFILHSRIMQHRLLAAWFFSILIIDLLSLLNSLMNVSLWRAIISGMLKQSQLAIHPQQNNKVKPSIAMPSKQIEKEQVDGLLTNSTVKPNDPHQSDNTRSFSTDPPISSLSISQLKQPSILANPSISDGYKKEKKVIDYERTYMQILLSSPIFNTTCRSMKVSSAMESSLVCRLSFILQYSRLAIFHILIVLSQKMPLFFVTLNTITQIAYVAVVSFLFWRYRHYRNPLIFLLEINQSLFMSFIFSIILCSQPMPSSLSQKICIYLIFAICASEYLLIIIFLSNISINFIKTNLCNRSKNKSKEELHNFLRFTSSEDYPCPSALTNAKSISDPIKPIPVNMLSSHIRIITSNIALNKIQMRDSYKMLAYHRSDKLPSVKNKKAEIKDKKVERVFFMPKN